MYAVNTELRITEHVMWHSTRVQPTVLATVASVKQTSVGTLYSLDYTSSKTANGKPVLVTKLLFERQLKGRVMEVVKKARKQRTTKQQLKAA
jgi:hypothetical protein